VPSGGHTEHYSMNGIILQHLFPEYSTEIYQMRKMNKNQIVTPDIFSENRNLIRKFFQNRKILVPD
jgi:hypothetical protein